MELSVLITERPGLAMNRGGSGIQKMVRPGSGCGHPVMCVTSWVLIINGCVRLGTDLFKRTIF